MKLKYEDYTKEAEFLENFSKDLVNCSVAALDDNTLLYTRVNLIHSVVFTKTFIKLRLNDRSNLVLNLREDEVYWDCPNIQLNLGASISSSDILKEFENMIVSCLYK